MTDWIPQEPSQALFPVFVAAEDGLREPPSWRAVQTQACFHMEELSLFCLGDTPLCSPAAAPQSRAGAQGQRP